MFDFFFANSWNYAWYLMYFNWSYFWVVIIEVKVPIPQLFTQKYTLKATFFWKTISYFSSKSIFMNIFVYCGKEYHNPCDASSRSRIFLFSLVYVICVYEWLYVFVSRLLAKRKTIQTRNLARIVTYSYWPYRKTGFLFFRSNHRDGR